MPSGVYKRRTLEDRFWSKVQKGGGCWVWSAGTHKGYGKFWLGKTNVFAHRFAYELLIGKIPAGLVLDHLCRNTACVRPEHLEPVTVTENTQRGLNWALRTHCVNSHELTPDNIILRPNGRWRRCRACISADNQKRYQTRKKILNEAA